MQSKRDKIPEYMPVRFIFKYSLFISQFFGECHQACCVNVLVFPRKVNRAVHVSKLCITGITIFSINLP